MPEPEAVPPDPWDELQPILDEELARLPDRYRLPIVLCDLEGRTRREVAGQLGIPEGTLSSRLTTARRMLAKRLTRRGLALSGGFLAGVLSQNAVSACVPTSVLDCTVEAANAFAAGQTAMSGVVSPDVAALTEGVLKAMLLNKLKTVTAMLLVLGVVAFGRGVFSGQAPVAAEEKPPKEATVQDQPFRVEPVPGTEMQRYVATFRDTGTVRNATADYNVLFDRATKVLGDHFQIEYANRFDGRIETHPTEVKLPDGSVIRRRAMVQITALDDGTFLVQVRVLDHRSADRKTGQESVHRNADLEELIRKRLELQPKGGEKAPLLPPRDEKRVRQYQVECLLVKPDADGVDLGRDGKGKVLAQPQLLLLEGQEGRFLSGGQVARTELSGGEALLRGAGTEGRVEFIDSGLSVRVTVVGLDEGRLRLQTTLERSEVDRADETGTQVSGNFVRSTAVVKLGDAVKLVEKDDAGKIRHWARIRVVKEETIVTRTRSAEDERPEPRD
jgi:hypothetical protein